MSRSPSSQVAGVALIIVLAFLALISVVVLAFFSSVTSQVTLTDAEATTATTEQLADSAVNIVMAQLVDATKGQDGSTALAWASQPGMVRTYDATGNPAKYYKLYSAEQLVMAGKDLTSTTDLPPPDWKVGANQQLYVDLNQPGVDSQNGLVYPIVDPQADGTAATPKKSATSPDNHSNDKMGAVLGFSVSSANLGFDATKDESPTNNRAPMPVRWLYMLQDGTMVSPELPTGGAGSSGSSNSATSSVVTVTGATKTNPIVARVAWWTDDECSKVNINTASEGIYWDVPRDFSFEDFGSLTGPDTVGKFGMAVCQPNQHEYQRYPGHPATVCLSPIFGSIPGLNPSWGYQNPAPNADLITAAQALSIDGYYKLAPRIGLPNASNAEQGGGGSQSGTKLITGSAVIMDTDKDRLYSSVDELMFTPLLNGQGTRIPNTATGASAATPNILLKSHLEKARFFLTAHSNAPEVTLFNTPRISIWPVNASAARRTPFDGLSAFCSNMGTPAKGDYTKDYFFTRSNSRSDSADYADSTRNGRNGKLYQYLKVLTSTNIPGFGGNFLTKWSDNSGGANPLGSMGTSDRDQVLTEIYDYIRSTNLQDRGTTYPYTAVFDTTTCLAGAGEVIPIKIPSTQSKTGYTQGFGRTQSITEFDLIFYCTKMTSPAAGAPAIPSEMRAVLVMQPSGPMQGSSPMKPKIKFVVKGLEKYRVEFPDAGGAATPPAPFLAKANPSPSGTGQTTNNGMNYSDGTDISALHGRSISGTECATELLFTNPFDGTSKPFSDSGGTSDRAAAAHAKYPFFSGAITIPPPNPLPKNLGDLSKPRTFKFDGNTDASSDNLVVEEWSDDGNASVLMQTYNLKFPSSANFIIPPNMSAGAFGSRNIQNTYNLVTTSDSAYGVQVAGRTSVPASTDGPTNLDPTAGDDRMIEGLNNVPYQRFRPHRLYLSPASGSSPGPQWAHGLMMSIGDHIQGGEYGGLVNVPNNYYTTNGGGSIYRNPGVPSRAGAMSGGKVIYQVKRTDGGPGDWDTGWGDQKDGAHINKPDEGDSNFVGVMSPGYRTPYMLGNHEGYATGTRTYFSPMRQVPSAMMFGSLPTGVLRMRPWETLSFAPRPDDTTANGGAIGHPGNSKTPKDHLIADLFWMPVVEPWAISAPFATTGKINMNYQIRPFTYIKRQTAIYAVMRATKFLAIPFSEGSIYKPFDASFNPGAQRASDARMGIDIARTLLQGFETKFNSPNNDLFRSATQICEVDLYPNGYTGTMANFWGPPGGTAARQLTGDNAREKPYVDLYPRLTTKSNTFTVHVRAQTLHKVPGTAPDQWDGSKDRVLGEYRGSSVLERYIDPNDSTIPDFASTFTGTPNETTDIDRYYKMRIVSTKRFAP